MVSTTLDCFIQRLTFRCTFLDEMVPRVGFEPTTYRLRSGCSTAELPGRHDREQPPAHRGVLASNPAGAKTIRSVNP